MKGLTMKRRTPTLTLAMLAAILGATTNAQASKSREEVRTETLQAIRDGDIVRDESGLTLREEFPARYPEKPRIEGKTREEVKAELAEATRMGDLLANNESGLTLREEFPTRYPAKSAVKGKSRAQVKAELAEAIRTGDMLAEGESGLTLREEFPQRYANLGQTSR
jgi:hypothetical protein